MKVLYMGQAPYRYLPDGFSERYSSVVTTPYAELVEPQKMHESLHAYVEELLHAARCGYDGVTVSEHSQSSYDISPNPNLAAAIVAHTTQVEGLDSAIAILGRSLGKSREPLKIAEEYAVIDVISGGRLIAGMPVGPSYDANQNGGIPPIETRLRAEEGRALLEKAWSAAEPFAWNGKYSRYPCVNIWPRPLQQPHPPFWVPDTGTPSLADMIDRNDVIIYPSWIAPAPTSRRIYDRFWDLADSKGWDHNPYRLASVQIVCVADTDAEARRLYGKHLQTHFRNSQGAIPAPAFALPGYIDVSRLEAVVREPGDLGTGRGLKTISFDELADTRAAIVGGVSTVVDQITEFVNECRIGNLLVMLQVGSMPHELARENISRFASDVLPRLRGIWEDDGWEHRWWPTGIDTRSSGDVLASV